MKRFWQLLGTVALLIVAWVSWQWLQPVLTPKAAKHAPPSISQSTEHDRQSSAQQSANRLWRVVTRRVITRAGRDALRQRLTGIDSSMLLVAGKEQVTLHAFDDPRLFASHHAAAQAAHQWQQAGIEANVMQTEDHHYRIGLGRYYEVEYAEELQDQLRRIGKPYHYQPRSFAIPVWRFTFPATSKDVAERLWQQLERNGVAMPALMPDAQFQRLYSQADYSITPIQAEK